MIPFNKPYIPWSSFRYLIAGARSGTIAGNGNYTKRCHSFFEERFGFGKVLLTSSCTDALEMSALLCNIGPGDEVIMPSYTFMSTANAFLLRGAKVLFADTLPGIPNVDPAAVEQLITPRTRAIVVVHYGGVACDMDRIMALADKHGIRVVEDAAHAIDSFYRGRPLGSIGHFGTFSFHETKNIISGEGGLLIINDPDARKRAEILWEKGTNRAAFYRGEIDKYGWVDIGSSYLPSDAVAAFLYNQLRRFDHIQSARKRIWHLYDEQLRPMEKQSNFLCPVIPDEATVNGNMYFLILPSGEIRDDLMAFLKRKGITALFHYLPLHASPYYVDKHDGRPLPNTNRFSSCILRLPFFNSLKKSQVEYIVQSIREYFISAIPGGGPG